MVDERNSPSKPYYSLGKRNVRDKQCMKRKQVKKKQRIRDQILKKSQVQPIPVGLMPGMKPISGIDLYLHSWNLARKCPKKSSLETFLFFSTTSCSI